MTDWTSTVALALSCVLVLYVARRASCSQTSHLLPPGPPGLPWVGTVIGIDASAPWKTYAEWAKTYGDIVHSRLFGRDIIIINSEKIAKELLENRSGNYSDRPHFVTTQLCGLGFNLTFLPYGDRWRLHRRLFHQTFRPEAVSRFLPLQHRKACHFIRRLLDDPKQLDNHLFEYTASIILTAVYDYDPASRQDEIVQVVSDVLSIVVSAMRPDVAITVGAFPFVLHLPSWFPGMSFKKEMAMARALSKDYLERPFEYTLQKTATVSVAAPSMVYDGLQYMEEKAISPKESWMEELKQATGSAFIAAAETSNAALMTFFLMMVLHPAVQEKAQAQIDTVVGNARLPTMDDRPLLPFIDAIIWEMLRCNPISPLAIPHATMDDDVYDGFHIPKGATVLANLWSMSHDESKYPNSHAFIPERFINEDGSLKPNDTEHITFGFGRRICPGKYFADDSMWGLITKVLAVFRILKPLDENGAETTFEPKFASGIAAYPLPFGYRIVPRFPEMDAEKLEQLIAASTV